MTEIINCPDCTFQNIFIKSDDKRLCEICEKDLLLLSPITQNFLLAQETIPEFFIPRNMIKLNGKINNTNLEFIVDTGCNTSCISYSIAKCCNLEHLIDTKYKGTVFGVGNKRILGTIHITEIYFEFGVLPISFIVIEDDLLSPPILLLGLDVFFSHGCIIDFKNREIQFNSTIKIPFSNN